MVLVNPCTKILALTILRLLSKVKTKAFNTLKK